MVHAVGDQQGVSPTDTEDEPEMMPAGAAQEERDRDEAEAAVDKADDEKEVKERDEAEAMIHGDESAEVRQVRFKRSPSMPSKKEVIQHRTNAHLPFRSWCSKCVAGRAADDAHRTRHGEEDNASPEIAFDYCHLKNKKATRVGRKGSTSVGGQRPAYQVLPRTCGAGQRRSRALDSSTN